MQRPANPLSRAFHRRGALPFYRVMADIPTPSFTPPQMLVPPGFGRESNFVKVSLALLFLVVIVWFGRGAVVSLFRGQATEDQLDLTNIPPQAVCAPATQTVRVNQQAILNASGGDPNDYKWYAPQGEPFTQTGSQATVRYTTVGPKAVVLVSRVRTAKCDVTVTQ